MDLGTQAFATFLRRHILGLNALICGETALADYHRAVLSESLNWTMVLPEHKQVHYALIDDPTKKSLPLVLDWNTVHVQLLLVVEPSESNRFFLATKAYDESHDLTEELGVPGVCVFQPCKREQTLHLREGSPCEQIDLGSGAIVHVVKNVSSYQHVNYDTFVVTVSDRPCTTTEPSAFYVIDGPHHDAFSHWVFESAIYLPFFHNLRIRFPTLKLLSRAPRSSKTNICAFFGILEKDIVYDLPAGEPNICVIPEYVSSLNNPGLPSKWVLLMEALHKRLAPAHLSVEKKLRILLSPRNKVENYQPNDRPVDTSDLENHLQNGPEMRDCEVMVTSSLSSFQEQINKVQSAKIMIVPDGSAFLVNGFFSRNARLIVLDRFTYWQSGSHAKVRWMTDRIRSDNEVVYVDKKGPYCWGDVSPHILTK